MARCLGPQGILVLSDVSKHNLACKKVIQESGALPLQIVLMIGSLSCESTTLPTHRNGHC